MGARRIVRQYDLTGHYMREFPSGVDAARHCNGVASAIYDACAGRLPTAYGFRWRYKDDCENIPDIEYSMILERAYGEITNIIVEYKQKVKRQLQIIRENGEKEPYHYRLVMDALQIAASDFRERSDKAFAEHKGQSDISEDGIDNIKIAIVERMALDYEMALCENDDGTINEIHDFAKNKAHLYTNLDAEEVLERIREKQKRFNQKANANINELLEMTEKFRRKRYAFSERNNPYRCPLCGGGMYVKTKFKTGSYLVGCSGCNLTEVVNVHQ